MMRYAWIMIAALAALGGAGALEAQASLQCERCHGELELLRQHVDSFDEARALLVPGPMVRGSAHGELSCTGCHTGFARFPHPDATETRSCASCHQDEAAAWERGIHAGSGGGTVVTCSECHGVHDVVGTEALASGAALRSMNATCAGCHETQRLLSEDPHAGEAGCHSCHAAHDVEPPSEPGSWMASASQPQVCGACHDAVAALWVTDVHGRATMSGDVEMEPGGVSAAPPTCSNCHGAHPIVVAGEREFSEAAVERCVACHERAAATFFGSYHGKATAVGSHVAATCVECHGAHQIFPHEDPRSTVAEANLVETCKACHEHAREAFVKYDSHPEPLNRERNPWIFWSFVFMNTMLVGTLVVFGAHTAAWWIRTMIDRRRGVSAHGGGGE